MRATKNKRKPNVCQLKQINNSNTTASLNTNQCVTMNMKIELHKT